jgi:hypothetical protein
MAQSSKSTLGTGGSAWYVVSIRSPFHSLSLFARFNPLFHPHYFMALVSVDVVVSQRCSDAMTFTDIGGQYARH